MRFSISKLRKKVNKESSFHYDEKHLKELVIINKQLLSLLEKEERADHTTIENFKASLSHFESELSKINNDVSHLMSEVKAMKEAYKELMTHVSSLHHKVSERMPDKAKEMMPSDIHNDYKILLSKFNTMLDLISKKQALDLKEIESIEEREKELDEILSYLKEVKNDLETKKKSFDELLSQIKEEMQRLKKIEEEKRIKVSEQLDSILESL